MDEGTVQLVTVTRQDVIDYLLETGLAETCLYYQTKGCKSQYLIDELRGNLWLWLMTYDESRLVDAFVRGHINCLCTQFLVRQFKSKNSPFYRTYRKRQKNEVDLEEARNVLDEDFD